MSQRGFAETYSIPLVDPDASIPELRFSPRGVGRIRSLRGRARRAVKGRRLAYFDSHFPWAISAFRYADALALWELRPDTVFFSQYATTDPFPAPVLPLADFPRVAPQLGITDVYGIFLNFMGGIVGVPRESDDPGTPADGIDLSGVLRREGIRSHVMLYPGGGLASTDASFARAEDLIGAADQVFSFVSSVLERFPDVVPVTPAVTDTSFYFERPHDLSHPVTRLLFAADNKPRKGLPIALAAQRLLDVDRSVHLVVAGPNTEFAHEAGRSAEFVGWQSREQLRALHAESEIFLSPVRVEPPSEGDGGVIDGFPTGAAKEAMSSGCLLVSANPERDHRFFTPGVHYVEAEATPAAFASAVRWAIDHSDIANAIARRGAEQVCDKHDVRAGARNRLQLMGF